MTLNDIESHLRSTTSRANFDAWISTNIEDLTDYFYSLSKEDLITLKIDTDFYFGVFTQSLIFRDFEITNNHTEPFDAFLFLLASVAENLAENWGLVGILDHLLSYLPESSVKYRLKALSLSRNIDNTRTDYHNHFSQILQLLQKAELLDEENHTLRLVDFLIYYYKKAESRLTERNYLAELEQLKGDFTDERTIGLYHFLGHVAIQELIAGRYPHELIIEAIESIVLYPSHIISNHFVYNINQPVFNHSQSKGADLLMGYDKDTVLNNILERGKTQFDIPYESLMPDEKVLLYCYFNMKKHFFTSVAVFQKLWTSLQSIISGNSYKPVFIDLGCGPLTSGLALAELYHSKTTETLNFNYIGIDISEAMLKKATEFSESDIFDPQSTFQFFKNWNDIDFSVLEELAGKNNPFFINASYLFANLSKEVVEDLAKFVIKLVATFKNVHFIFQNPDRVDRNKTWEHFKKLIAIKTEFKAVEHVTYKASRNSFREPGKEDVYFEILTLKP